MSATMVLSEPKSFSLRRFLLEDLILGVLLIIWAIMLLPIAMAAHFDMPVVAFDGQELVAPF
jgi:hypothetical protein